MLTNVPPSLTNVVAVAAANANHALALKENGTVVAWGSDIAGETAVPSVLTNPATANVMAIATGFYHSIALRNDGTVVTWGRNDFNQTNTPSALTNVHLIAGGFLQTFAAINSSWIQYPIDVSKDLLLIYNTNSVDSKSVKDYYLQHRPLVVNANVLGIGCTNVEAIRPDYYTNIIELQVKTWLTNNPTKRPQYVILFPDIPSQVTTSNETSSCGDPTLGNPSATPSVQYRLHTTAFAPSMPFVSSINFASTNDCKGYIDKLEYFGTNYASGKIIISASTGGYGNTKYYFDDVRYPQYSPYTPGATARDSVLANGVAATNVTYVASGSHITSASSVAGFLTWGYNGGEGATYAVDGSIVFTGSSRWYPIETIESFNGQRCGAHGNLLRWFASNAFGGTSYSNTPCAAVTHVLEPGGDNWNNAGLYFGLWAQNKAFSICAWKSSRTVFLQAVGDPFIAR